MKIFQQKQIEREQLSAAAIAVAVGLSVGRDLALIERVICWSGWTPTDNCWPSNNCTSLNWDTCRQHARGHRLAAAKVPAGPLGKIDNWPKPMERRRQIAIQLSHPKLVGHPKLVHLPPLVPHVAG